MVLFQNGKRFIEYIYTREDDFEAEVLANSKLLFGKDSIYIDAKRKIKGKALGGTIPDGFLFDLSDKYIAEFYLVEVELSSHDFYAHIFPQITKFFAFFKNSKSQSELVEKIFSIVNSDQGLKKEFKGYLGDREIFKFIKDTVENSRNILLIIDGDKRELPEIIETYSDTWGKMVKLMILKKFKSGDEFTFSLNPDFENVEFADAQPVGQVEPEGTKYSEEYHLEDVNETVKKIYFSIKENLLKANKELVFNPQKYYISIIYKKNFAFFQFRKKKVRLVVMLPEEEVKARIKEHTIKHLSEGVQKFWNGPSCEIIIESTDKIEEVIALLKSLVI